jgi:predicted esterase
MTDLHNPDSFSVAGKSLKEAKRALILLHGRGADAEDILSLGKQLQLPETALIAPKATNNTWYPERFLVETRYNEPWLSSALDGITAQIERCLKAGLSMEQIFLCGFSQGACLVSEYAARHPKRYGGVIAFSGGVIGAEGEGRPTDPGSLDQTPVFLGCSTIDPHIPANRVHETATLLRVLGAKVTLKLYPLMPHIVNADEMAIAQNLILNAPKGEPRVPPTD